MALVRWGAGNRLFLEFMAPCGVHITAGKLSRTKLKFSHRLYTPTVGGTAQRGKLGTGETHSEKIVSSALQGGQDLIMWIKREIDDRSPRK